MTIVLYLIKWAIALSLLYALYALTLRCETFHSLKRCVLLGVLAVSAVLPFVQLQVSPSLGALTRGGRPVSLDNLILSGGQSVETMHEAEPVVRASLDVEEVKNDGTELQNIEVTRGQAERPSEWIALCLLLLWGGVALVFFILYARSLLATGWIIHRSRSVKVDGVQQDICVLASNRLVSPCSWMHWILLPEETLARPRELRTVLLHEQAHVRLGHSWDMMLAEVTARLLWFLPFAWMIRRELADVHEFEADQAVLQAGVAQTDYDDVLVAQAIGARLQPVVNAFNQTQVKTRLAMMYATASSGQSRMKALWMVPVVGIVVLLFACYKPKPPIESSIVAGTWRLIGIRLTNLKNKQTAPRTEWVKGKDYVYRIHQTDSTLMMVTTLDGTSDTKTSVVGSWLPQTEDSFDEHLAFVNSPNIGARYNTQHYDLSSNEDTLYLLKKNQPHEGFLYTELWLRVSEGSVQRSHPDIARTNISLVSHARKEELTRSVREMPTLQALYYVKDFFHIECFDHIYYRFDNCEEFDDGIHVSMHAAPKRFDGERLYGVEEDMQYVALTLRQVNGKWNIVSYYPEDTAIKNYFQVHSNKQNIFMY